MAFEEGGMASGLLLIAVSILFAAGFGFIVLHFVPGTPFWYVFVFRLVMFFICLQFPTLV